MFFLPLVEKNRSYGGSAPRSNRVARAPTNVHPPYLWEFGHATRSPSVIPVMKFPVIINPVSSALEELMPPESGRRA